MVYCFSGCLGWCFHVYILSHLEPILSWVLSGVLQLSSDYILNCTSSETSEYNCNRWSVESQYQIATYNIYIVNIASESDVV